MAAGTYKENVVIPSLTLGIQLYGGFAGTETDRAQRDPAARLTILDANYAGTVVTYQSGCYNVNVLDGFTITNGRGTPIPNPTSGKTDLYGGGILCKSWSAPVIRNNVITSCSASGASYDKAYGAGIAVLGGEPLIDGNRITNNIAGNSGGGIYCAAGTIVRITNNDIQDNWGALGGGGISACLGTVISRNQIVSNDGSSSSAGGVYIDGTVVANTSAPNTTVEYNVFRENNYGAFEHYGGSVSVVGTPIISIHDNLWIGNKGDWGSALYLLNSYAYITNNTFVYNVPRSTTATDHGVINAHNAPGTGAPLMRNNIFAWNSAGFWDGTVDGVHAFVLNNCFYQNTQWDYHTTNAYPDPTTGNANIKVDPLFAHASTYASYGDFHLAATSPCRETGLDTAVSGIPYDLDGEPRKDGTHVDMGAYEFVSGVTLVFSTRPTDTVINQHITPGPTVTALRSNGQVYTRAYIAWMSIKPGTGVAGATLGSDSRIDSQVGAYFVNGVATFPTLSVGGAAFNYVLTASWAGVTGDSQPFKITLPYRYVTTTGSDSNDGSSWQKAKLTPASALDGLLAPGGSVFVKGGAYTGTCTVPAGAKLIGGFDGAEGEGDWPRKLRDNETILNGGAAGAVVTIAAAAGPDTVVDGFTITNGSGRRYIDPLRHAVWRGGGIYAAGASPTIRWNHIIGNTATQGGGVYCAEGEPVLLNNIIENNTAASTLYYAAVGGGIALVNAPGEVAGNLISNNASNGAANADHPASSAGGLLLQQSSAMVRDTTIAANSAASNTSIEIAASAPTFVNNIIAYNNGAIKSDDTSEIRALYNDVYRNAEPDYVGPGDPFSLKRNMRVNPLFVDLAGGNFRLQDESPCRDAGDKSVVSADDLDLDFNPRVNNDAIDMGAYERRVFNVLALDFVDATTLMLTYSDRVDSNPANGVYIQANYTVVDVDNANAPLPVTLVQPVPSTTGARVSLSFASLPLGHHVKVAVSGVRDASGVLVNPVRNRATSLLPVEVTFDLMNYLTASSGLWIMVNGTSTGETVTTFSNIGLAQIYGTYELKSQPRYIMPGVLKYRYVPEWGSPDLYNETDRTFNLSNVSPQTVYDVLGRDIATTFNLTVYADKAIPAGKDVYVTGGFSKWSTTPGASPGPVKLTPAVPGALKGLFSATTTVYQSVWLYKYVLIDRATGAVDSTWLNADNRTLDMHPTGTPPALVVNDTAGTAATVEVVAQILRVAAGLVAAPSPQTGTAFMGLDVDASGRIDVKDAIRFLRQ